MARREVELHQAFLWVCEDCGRDNFVRSVVVEPETIPAHVLAAAEESFGDCDGILVTAPTVVTCEHCGAEFSAMDDD